MRGGGEVDVLRFRDVDGGVHHGAAVTETGVCVCWGRHAGEGFAGLKGFAGFEGDLQGLLCIRPDATSVRGLKLRVVVQGLKGLQGLRVCATRCAKGRRVALELSVDVCYIRSNGCLEDACSERGHGSDPKPSTLKSNPKP